MADFGDPSTWEMNVDQFIDSGLPKEKPQELLDLQEQNRKQRLLQSLQKIGPRLEDSSLDFINRENFYIGSAAPLAKFGMGLLENLNFPAAKKKVQDAYGLLKTTRNPENKNLRIYEGDTSFFDLFNDFKDSFFGGQVSGATQNLNLGGKTAEANRVKVRKKFKDYGQPLISGAKSRSIIDAPEDFIRLPDAKIKVKFEDKDYFKNIELPENVKKNEYYTTDDLVNILKIDPDDRVQLAKDLNKFKAKKIKSGDLPKFQLNSSIDVLTKSGLRTPKGGKPDDFKIKRTNLEKDIDPKYVDFFGTLTQRATKLGKDVDTFLPRAIESRGHAVDLSVSAKYPKLFKNSNADKFSSLVYQDPLLNEKIFQQIGFGKKPEKNFEILEKFVGKKVTPKIQKQLISSKEDFARYHQEAVDFISNPKKAKEAIIQSAKSYTKNKSPEKTKRLIKQAENIDLKYLQTYLKNQDKRIQKLNIKIPKVGETFKSENFFADLSTVDPDYVVGKVTSINPKVLRMKELSQKELELYQNNVTNQYKDYLSSFYKDVKTKQGQNVYSEGDIQDLLDAFDFGTGGPLEGTGKKARQALSDPVKFERRKKYAEGTEDPSEDLMFEEFLEDASTTSNEGLPPEATAVGSLYGMKYAPQIAKGFGNILKGAGTPLGVIAGETLLPGGVKDRIEEEGVKDTFTRDPLTYAGLPLATLGQEFLKTKPLLQRIMNLGLSPKMVRAGTPVGLGLMGLTSLYDSAKTFQEEFDALSPEQQKEYLEEQRLFGEDVQGAAEGGRIGYSNGSDGKALAIEESLEAFQRYLKAGGKLGYKDFIALGNEGVSKFFNSGGRVSFADGNDPKNPGRRTFIKGMGILAALPFIGKFIKPAAPLVKKLANSNTVMPDWFPNFVDKFVGRSIGKKIDADLMEYTNPDLPNIKLTRKDDGSILVEGTNEYNEAYNISYEPPGYELIDETTGKAVKTKGEFEAVEGRHVAMGPEDYDTDPFYADDLDELFTSDIADMEKYATGNVTKTVKDAFGTETGLKKGKYDVDMAQGQAENRADILRDEGLDEID